MKIETKTITQNQIYKLIQWCLIAIIIGALSGFASVAFLKSVDWAIAFRRSNDWLIAFLPFVGYGLSVFYNNYGESVQKGNNLVLDEVHSPQKKIPFRMVPMIFISTVLAHLFGASVGREGAAVQMGAGISDQFSKIISDRKMILKMGMSAGFASVFGAPISGAIFGFEVLYVGSIFYDSLLPCLVAAIVGYYTSVLLGVGHVDFFHAAIPAVDATNIFTSIVAGIFFGYAAKFFIFCIESAKVIFSKLIKNSNYRPFFGGLIVAALYFLIGSDRYHSLGEEIIHASFTEKVYPWDFLGKILMTTFSVGSGFRGGEVMSLFYIGSTLGNTLSSFLPMNYPVLAALGFVSVFAGALNTPMTAVILAFEFFGSKIGIYASLSVVTAYLFSGARGIYHSQKYMIDKDLK